MRLFDGYYYYDRLSPDIEVRRYVKKSEIKGEFVYRDPGILSNLWRWIKCGF